MFKVESNPDGILFQRGHRPPPWRQEFGFTGKSQDLLCFGYLPRLANRWREHGTEAGYIGFTNNPVSMPQRSRRNAECCWGSKNGSTHEGFQIPHAEKKHCLPKRNRRGQVEETCNPSGDSSENVMSDNSRYPRQRLHSHAVRDGGIIHSLINPASVIFAVTLL